MRALLPAACLPPPPAADAWPPHTCDCSSLLQEHLTLLRQLVLAFPSQYAEMLILTGRDGQCRQLYRLKCADFLY
jgi:hypothetical protein